MKVCFGLYDTYYPSSTTREYEIQILTQKPYFQCQSLGKWHRTHYNIDLILDLAFTKNLNIK